ncbi:MAG TPA: hypothetical protein VKB89_24105 [Xanthobacteraceae bacterium]|nr:hypothetical protein [Xanthobacteraceae bacterium]
MRKPRRRSLRLRRFPPEKPEERVYPMLTGSVIARKASTKMSTLQIVAPIPAFIAVSMLELRRPNNAAFVASVFGGMSFALSP